MFDQNEVTSLGKQFSDAVIKMHYAIAKSAGLSGTDHKFLNLLLDDGPMTAGQWATKSGLTTGAITGLIDRLEERHLVRREFDKKDRRKVLIVADRDAVQQLMGDVSRDLQQRMADYFGSLPADEIQVIQRYINSSIAIMTEVTDQLTSKK
jgi:DNA-binding MarR family transcriptional regulator